jgi:plastocyanin
VVFTAVTGAPENIPLVSNVQVSRTFNTVGAFAFDCTVHAGMSGTITVK